MASKPSSTADMTPEQLRSAHVRVLEQLQQAKREKADLEMQLSERARHSERMKPEELDSLYVEERRQIESLQRAVAALTGQAAGGRARADAGVAAAQAESQRLAAQCEELREQLRRTAQLAAAQVEKVRSAYTSELEERASECEASKARVSELGLELGLQRQRADTLERALAESRAALAAAEAAAEAAA